MVPDSSFWTDFRDSGGKRWEDHMPSMWISLDMLLSAMEVPFPIKLDSF